MAKNNNSINFDKIIKNLSPDGKASDKPWFKKKVSIITMSSTLGAGALATVIAVPIVLTSGTSSGEITASEQERKAIADFNSKTTQEKIDLYNSIMVNHTNDTAIKNYIKKANAGMSNNVRINVQTPTDQSTLTIFNKLKYLLDNREWINTSSISNFLSIKGISSTSNSIINNDNPTSTYFQQATTFNDNTTAALKFLSPIKKTIVSVTMKDDLSIEMTLPSNQSNVAFSIRDDYAKDYLIYYNQKIIFSNSTLFPGMSDYVRKNILKI